MRICSNVFFKKIPVFLFVLFAFAMEGKAQIIMSTANCTISTNEVQMDILVTNTGTIDLRWNAAVLRMVVPAIMIPPGAQTYAINYLGGSDFPLSWPAVYPATGYGSNYNASNRLLTWTTGNTSAYNNTGCGAPLISAGQTKTIGRFSFKITSSNFVQGAAANFTWHTTSGCILYQLCNSIVTGYNQGSGLTLQNPCALTVPGVFLCQTTATATSTAVSCFGNTDGTATITIAGPAGSGDPGTYSIDGGGPQSFTTNPFTIPGLGGGSHVVSITNPVISATCATIAFTINIPSPVAFTASPSITNSSCPGSGNADGAATVYLSYGTSGTYTFDGGSPQTFTTNPFTITGLAAGSHHIIATLATGGCVSPNTLINIGSQTNPTGQTYNSSSCAATGVIRLYSNSLAICSYSIDGINYQTSNTFSNLEAGGYTGYVKYPGGCIGTLSLGVTKDVFSINPSVWPSSACTNTGKIIIYLGYRANGLSPFTYSIDAVNYQPGNTFLNLAPGTYTAYMKDALGCLASRNVIVPALSAFTVTARHTNSSFCVNDGTIQADDPQGGAAPFSYSLNGITFQQGKSFSGLAPGDYTLYVKDINNCYATSGVTIGINGIGIDRYAWNASSCSANNGKIQLFISVGTYGPYTYSIDGNNFQTSNLFTNLAPGYYTGWVKDSKGCLGHDYPITVGPESCIIPTFTKNDNIKQFNEVVKSTLKVQVYPNPSIEAFTLLLEGYDSKVKVSINVTDVLGRKVYQTEGTNKLQYSFGKGFIAGIYYLQVMQGNEKKVIKLIKE